jgi:hypothetical protein
MVLRYARIELLTCEHRRRQSLPNSLILKFYVVAWNSALYQVTRLLQLERLEDKS